MKLGQKPQRVYDPAPLLAVDHLQITPQGVATLLPDERFLLDVHNRLHPDSRFSGLNSVSIGFTSHYARMRDRFGEHMQDGVAGENILVETTRVYSIDDFRYGVVVHCHATEEYLWLGDVTVAHPCVEFSRFALENELAEENSRAIKVTLQFLDDGTRGFYATPVMRDTPPVVRLGDRVYVGGA